MAESKVEVKVMAWSRDSPTGSSGGCWLAAEVSAKGIPPNYGSVSMEQQAREQAFISALTTEQFVLQAARSANVGEMTGRATIYMGAVSSALIALWLPGPGRHPPRPVRGGGAAGGVLTG